MNRYKLVTSGISFIGFYNDYLPYDGCTWLSGVMFTMFLYMVGNCLNNNTAVYCIILGNTLPHNVTGPLTILKIQGSSVYSLYFEAIEVSFIHMHVFQ